jgi:hypothetical protein
VIRRDIGRMTVRHRLTGQLTVGLPPALAFPLFTALGEREWVEGWEPRFPIRADDDTAPGTVFETGTGDRTTTWVVLDRTAGRHIRYARVLPRVSAGTVEVTLDETPAGSDVTVHYDLTALTSESGRELDEFAAGYPGFLLSWQKAIAAALAARD